MTEQLDNEFAKLAWKLTAACCSARAARLLPLLSWPFKFSLLLDDDQAQRCLTDFEADMDIFNMLLAMPYKSAPLKQVFNRHLFHKVHNEQFMLACKELGFKTPVHADIKKIVIGHMQGIMTTNINEEIVGMVKNFKEAKSANRFRKPEVSMGRILMSKLLEKRFQYKFVVADMATETKQDKLEKTDFYPSAEDWSLPFGNIVSGTSSAPFYSPSAANIGVPVADLFMLRDANFMKDFMLVKYAFWARCSPSTTCLCSTIRMPRPSFTSGSTPSRLSMTQQCW